MDLQSAKDLNAGMWLFAKVGVLVCFGLSGLLLAATLWTPAQVRSDALGRPSVHLGLAPAGLLPG